MKKKLLALLLTLTMALSLAACGGGEDAAEEPAGDEGTTNEEAAGGETSGDLINIGFAQVGHESDWRAASTNSAYEVFSEENGYNLSFSDADNDQAVQIQAVRTFIQQGMDYIIIDPITATGWDAVLTECEDAGIPVFIIDRTVDDSDKYVSWVGSDFTTEGKACGEWLKAYAEAKGIAELNILVIEGSVGASATLAAPRASTRSLRARAGTSSPASPATSPRPAARRSWSPSARATLASSTWSSARTITRPTAP